MASDKASEQAITREVQSHVPALLPSNNEYRNFSTALTPNRMESNQALIKNGILNDLQLNFDEQSAPNTMAGTGVFVAQQPGTFIDYPAFKVGVHSYSLGADWEQNESRLPTEKVQDFLSAVGRNATNSDAYKQYARNEMEKFIGIGEGLNIAKENTKAAAAAGWNALTDGTVSNFLSKPNAINDPLFKSASAALDTMSKDPQATNKVLEGFGKTISESSEHYSKLGQRDQGHVIGQAMFGLVNPEGSTEAADATAKIADTVAMHVDNVTMQTISDSRKASRRWQKQRRSMPLKQSKCF